MPGRPLGHHTGTYERRAAPRTSAINIALGSSAAVALASEANRRGITESQLASDILETVLLDDLLKAVLDDGQ